MPYIITDLSTAVGQSLCSLMCFLYDAKAWRCNERAERRERNVLSSADGYVFLKYKSHAGLYYFIHSFCPVSSCSRKTFKGVT